MNGDSASVFFMGAEFLIAPGVLLPRKETELLGRAAVELVRNLAPAAPRLVDMCCGIGNLACGIALQVPDAEIWASDLSHLCITVAQRNVERLALADRVRIRQGDLFAGLDGLGLEGSIDMVVCNPPYISRTRLNGRADLLAREPREAFDGGPYGFSVHQRVIKDASAYLRPGGALLFEFGLGQERQVERLFQRAGSYDQIRYIENESGEPRVALAHKKTC